MCFLLSYFVSKGGGGEGEGEVVVRIGVRGLEDDYKFNRHRSEWLANSSYGQWKLVHSILSLCTCCILYTTVPLSPSKSWLLICICIHYRIGSGV